MVQVLRRYTFTLILALVLCAAAAECAAQPRTPSNTREMPEGAFAVIEYFTSENCVSCQRSSESIRKFDEASYAGGRRIFVLSYHVDTVNDALWQDKLVRPEFGERQRMYLRQLRKRGSGADAYVVNGQQYLKGEDIALLQRAVVKELFKRPLASISADPKWTGEALIVNYKIGGLEKLRRPFFSVVLAVVERHRSQKVDAGANINHTFEHTNSVRQLLVQRIESEGDGNAEILLRREMVRENTALIMFVQDPQNERILGAERFEFIQNESKRSVGPENP